MKKLVSLSLCAVLLLGLAACSSGPKPAVSARDFDTRLTGLSTVSFSYSELLAISSGVIHENEKNVVPLNGWYAETGILDRQEYRRDLRLNGFSTTAAIIIKDKQVSQVQYSFKDVDLLDAITFWSIDVYADDVPDIQYIDRSVDTQSDAYSTAMTSDELIEQMSYDYVRGNTVYYMMYWNYTGADGLEYRIGFSYMCETVGGIPISVCLLTFSI